ncbi:MAG: 50S ribosomal protein L15 [Vampirovibrionales bacterium]|nr:50S ribosomal protein L15 [Vampirovibrionales bacterium]
MSSSAPAQSAEALNLSNVRPAKGAVKNRLRVGRGRASGAGKTCNRGHNGEGQRSGQSRKRGFEGGQMPQYRKMPKIGKFFQPRVSKWLELNVGDLPRVLAVGETALTYEVLRERGFLRPGMEGLRLLGKGECDRKVTVHAHHVTAGAREKIEAAGGAIELAKAP